MAGMYLNELLQHAGIEGSTINPRITGISLNSTRVRPGDLFVALGAGKRHIAAALAAGAVAVLADGPVDTAALPLVTCTDAGQHLPSLLQALYPGGFAALNLFAVTGTNGKTSCAHFLTQALGQAERCGMIGTLGYGELGHISYTGYTTPDLCEMYRILAQFEAEAVSNVVMEVSSHALEQGRVRGLAYRGAIFTNLTQDHLDYHQTMEAYFAAKQKLFTDFAPGFSVINGDDAYGRRLIAAMAPGREVVVYGRSATLAGHEFVLAEAIRESHEGLKFAVRSSWGEFQVNSRLFGQYNVYNLLAVAAVLFKLGHGVEAVVSLLQAIRPVTGRLEDFQGAGQPRVFVDFAHTPDALEQTLQALRNSFDADIYCVFGCGGDRDRGKRPLMGAVASQNCKKLILTDDNPRSEDPRAIVADIIGGIAAGSDYVVEHDRRKAIALAIQTATEHDVVLIAGKGHETTQTIGEQVLPFNDGEVVREVMAA